MKSLSIICLHLILLLLAAACGSKSQPKGASESTRNMLDREMTDAPRYVHLKEERIDSLRHLLSPGQDPQRRFDIIQLLISEYEAFKADSALHYVNLNLASPIANEPVVSSRLLLKKADLYSHAGLFSDALALMDSVSPAALPKSDRERYFANYCGLYQYMVEYNTDFDLSLQADYERMRRQYADSIRLTSDSLSLTYAIYVMPELAREGNPDKALSLLEKNLASYPMGSREYSILASIIAYVHTLRDDRSAYLEYISRSAVSDLRGAVMENMSFRAIATAMYEEGDVERANIFLKKSIADANFYSARMRNAQSLKMLPMIDEAYAARQRELYGRMKIMIAVVSILAVGLTAALYFIRRQYRRLKVANANVARSNSELSQLSEKLRAANSDLEVKNAALNEGNLIKEQYTGLFMGYSATAINALQRYHHSLRLMAAQGVSKSALQKKLESSEFIDSTIKEFYAKFDEAILNIYPDFPDKVNALLRPEERIHLKPGEILNTELRIQALIRIGISENAKIAEFLRCSITTVYTYRSKVRRRAINPDSFESDILLIS